MWALAAALLAQSTALPATSNGTSHHYAEHSLRLVGLAKREGTLQIFHDGACAWPLPCRHAPLPFRVPRDARGTVRPRVIAGQWGTICDAPPPAGEPPLVPKHMRSIMQMSYGAMKRSIGVIDAYLYERIHWQADL
mgnify:CR=1 FL=1